MSTGITLKRSDRAVPAACRREVRILTKPVEWCEVGFVISKRGKGKTT
jgi:hypothetical protein